MELKDRAYLKGKLKDEFKQIEQTGFWKDYMVRLGDERRIASRHCETDIDVLKWQGFIRCIDTVYGLPTEVIEVTPRKIL